MSDPLPAPDVARSAVAATTVYLQGATLTEWTPASQEPVLYVSPASRFMVGTAIRGGVPICFPWFGPGRPGDLTPAHGPARLTAWRRAATAGTAGSETGGTVTELAYELTSGDLPALPERADLPGGFDARYVVRAGAELELALTVTNTSDRAFSYEAALHAYLAVGDVEQVVIEGLEECSFVDKTAGGEVRRPAHEALAIRGPVDRVYASTRPVGVVDPVLKRVLVVSKEGSANTIVWNPGAEQAARMADVGPGEWRRFVCVEAGNVLADAITLAPGRGHTLTYRLRIEPLE